MNGHEARFDGVRRLVGREASDRLGRAHVCVIGLGGVGSWAAEALARSGVGQLTIVDFDEVCISNTNRQLHALAGGYGQPKVEVMAQRLRAVNPECAVRPVLAFFTAGTASQILGNRFDHVVDAIDDVAMKCLLIVRCRDLGLPVIVSGGAGGRRDPTRVRVGDLAYATHDKLLRQVREQLRKEHGFPPGQVPFGVDCVFSQEWAVYPAEDGTICREPKRPSRLRIDCRSGLGTAAFVTGTFGFAAAGHVVAKLAGAEGRGRASTGQKVVKGASGRR